jgi:hypothetical protein
VKGEVIIFGYKHYDFEGNKGLSVIVLGDRVQTNNERGLQVTEATVSNHDELITLGNIPIEKFPAKFSCSMGMVNLKAKNGKSVAGIALSNLSYIESVQLTSVK